MPVTPTREYTEDMLDSFFALPPIVIVALVSLSLIISTVGLWIGAKLVGLNPTAKSILPPAIGTSLFSMGLTFLVDSILDRSIILTVLGYASIILDITVWHLLLKRSHPTNLKKSTGSFLIGYIGFAFVIILIGVVAILSGLPGIVLLAVSAVLVFLSRRYSRSDNSGETAEQSPPSA